MSYFNPESWRVFTQEEWLAFIESLKPKSKKRGKKKRGRGSMLVLQRSISPFDAYTYLHARFGPPNGMQANLVEEDSGNLFHWDYHLKAGEKDIMFVGASEEVHVWFDDPLDDSDCLRFISSLRADFGRVGKDKGRFASTLEKWSIFPNQYLAVATRCAELYDTIAAALPKVHKRILADNLISRNLTSAKKRRLHSKLMNAITGAPTELAMLTPVMFESFIGLIVAGFIKPEIKREEAAFNAFVRAPLNQKLVGLADHCLGFERAIQQDNPAFGRYWTVVNKRNDVLHGNVDPVRDALEIVYFHGKRPLFKSGGDRIREHWARLVNQYRPQDVIDDYLATHEFIIEIMDHLTPQHRRSLWTVMGDTQPGWDNRRKIFGQLFPNMVATTNFDGMRYDWQLSAS